MTHTDTPKTNRRGRRGERPYTVVMVKLDTHNRLRRFAQASGRKVQWLADHFIASGLENAERN